MPLPDRPVDGEDIATEWGQEIHDRVLAPKGVRAHGAGEQTVNTTIEKLNLDVADQDPGVWLDAANDRLVVPSGAEGLYVGTAVITFRNTNAGVRGYVYVNGAQRWAQLEQGEGTGIFVHITISIFGHLVAGDVITCYANRRTSGSNPAIQVTTFGIARIGDDIGA